MKEIRYIILILLCIITSNIKAQKVGLVLSGGGAKGLTHIGIIRALEENNIPIDYITGTSMGAIIGSLYAMGYSPDEMETLLKSDDFKRWYSGEVEQKYVYYFKKNLPTPDFISIRLSLQEQIIKNKEQPKVKTQFLPQSVIDPIQMNLAFLDLFSRATAACSSNFNKLFVPFRCIASDVYNKKEVIFKSGDLGDAVRASMSFPIMFKPLEINGILTYDGGIYNNFPTDVMKKDFNPDIIIGSVVSSNPSKPTEGDWYSQLENMIMQKSNYALPDSNGILMTFQYNDISLMDFDKIEKLEKIGYDRTIQMMDTIKSKIYRRTNKDNVQLRRLVFKSEFPELYFHHIYVDGVNVHQASYIKNAFQQSTKDIFTFEELKQGYFRLLSDNMIAEIIPHAVYNQEDKTYDLHLKVKMQDNILIRVGGSVSSSSSNQIHFGATYQNMAYLAKEITFDGQLGKVYNNIQLMTKFEFPFSIPISFRAIGSMSTFDYFKKDKIFSHSSTPAFNQKDEYFVKLLTTLPFLTNNRAEFGIGYGVLKDNYIQSNTINFDEVNSDMTKYQLFGGFINFNGSTLNYRQFPTSGEHSEISAQLFLGKEKFYPGTANTTQSYENKYQSWIQFSIMKEAYHNLSSTWTLGWYLQALYASKNFSSNYVATKMNACEFSPTANSKLSYHDAFRANQYLAGGIRPILKLGKYLHFRTELYGFVPIYPIKCDANNRAYYGHSFSKFEYMGEASLVCHLPFTSISLYVNHFSNPKTDWNVGITLGWQLFNYRFIE
jgi:NTE family protein